MNVNSSQRKRQHRVKGRKSRSTPLSSSTDMAPTQTPSAPLLSGYRSSRRQCLKCQGWVVTQSIDLSEKIETRCLNCGWQPQFGTRIVQETEEAKAIRRFTAGFLSGGGNALPSTVEHLFVQSERALFKRHK